MDTVYANDRASERSPRLRYIAEKIGTRHWCVAPRLTERLKQRGYEAVVSSRRLEEIEREWEHANPVEARRPYGGGRLLNQLQLSDRELAVVREHLVAGDSRLRSRDAREIGDILTAIDALRNH